MEIRTGDVVSVRPESLRRTYFQDLTASQFMHQEHGLAWLETEPGTYTIKVIQEPSHEDGEQLADVQAIIEFYSR